MNRLVIDGDSSTRETLETFFSEKGHDVITCSSARGALAGSDQASPDIAMIDAGVLDMTEQDLLDRMQRALPGVRLLVIIPHGHEEACKKAKKGGASAWIEEPLGVGGLERVLDRPPPPGSR